MKELVPEAAENASVPVPTSRHPLQSPPQLPDEEARLQALERYAIMDSLPEQAYDDIVLLASQICGTPIATMSLIDRDRQWFKAFLGLDVQETPRDYAFCAYAIAEPDEVTVVSDARHDVRFQHNPLVTGDPNIGFYAGAPLITPDGHALGTLCVIDHHARGLTDEQRQALEALSRQVMAQLELRVKMRELNRSEERFQTFMDNSPALNFIKDAQGRYNYVNQPYLNRFGLTAEQVLGKTDWDLWSPKDAQELRAHDQSVMDGGVPVQMTEEVTESDGENSYWLVFKFPLHYEQEAFLGGVAFDITPRKRYERQLEDARRELEIANQQLSILSATDALTGLENRRAFDARLESEWQRARRQNSPLSLLLLDIDRFKQINDDFGHPVGDEVLQQVAHILKETARASDVVARFGGEEFVVISPDTEAQGAHILAERFRTAIENAVWPQRPITVSIGVKTVNFSGENVAPSETAQLIEVTDRALYAAKQNGRNRVEIAPS